MVCVFLYVRGILSQSEDLQLDYECVLMIEGEAIVVAAFVEKDESRPDLFYIICQMHKVFPAFF